MLETIILPPEIIDGLIALGAAVLGWFARLLSKKKEVKQTKEENEKLKEIILHYDGAARDALKYARKPQPPKEDEKKNQ